jgi:CDP-diacylglycerol--glycerol-3-phosphate 3-phosphatidyltransferase
MASIYDLKPAFQNVLRPITRFLAKIGVTANQITILALLISMATGGLILWMPTQYKILILVPIVLFIRMALNAIDGMLAREHDMKTPVGAILNELGDVLSDSFLYLPMAIVPGFPSIIIVINVLLAVITEMAAVVAVQIGASRRYEGPMGKSDRAFLFGLIALLTGCGLKPGLWTSVLFWIMTALLVITIFNRSIKALREINA